VIRTTLPLAYIHRPLRPLYGWHEATPQSGFLDPAWDRSTQIWPGMVAMKTAGEQWTLLNGTGVPSGLFANYIGGDGVDEPLDVGLNVIAVWVLAPTAQFQVLSPAFDASLTWTDPGNGTDLLIYGRTATGGSPTATTGLRGQLVPAGASGAGTTPVARLVSVDSATQITIAGLIPRS
jgi:hypothetical protein